MNAAKCVFYYTEVRNIFSQLTSKSGKSQMFQLCNSLDNNLPPHMSNFTHLR